MNPATDFSDLRDDNHLFTDPTRTTRPQTGATLYRETCRKCRGTGRWDGPGDCIGDRSCTECKGRGFHEYKQSELERHAAKERRDARKVKAKAAIAEAKLQDANAWREANPNEAAWLDAASARGFGFAQSLSENLNKFGSLTDGQILAIRRCIVQDEERAAARKASEKQATVVDISRIEHVFAIASKTGLRWPKLRLASYIFSPAPASGRNAGSIYVKRLAHGDVEQEYLGKITGGKLFPSRDCKPEDQATITEVAARPQEAAEKYGRLTGNCAICARPLLREDSVGRGIGPICAEKFGFNL